MQSKARRPWIYLSLILLGLCLLPARPTEAANGWLSIRGKQPFYVQNMNMMYYKAKQPVPALIVLIAGEKKYIEYQLDELRYVKFLEFVGHRYSHPVFKVRIGLKDGGADRTGLLMPISFIKGFANGRQWKYDLKVIYDDTTNAENIKEFRVDPVPR